MWPVIIQVAQKIELQYFLYFYGINLEREIHDIKLPGLAQIPGSTQYKMLVFQFQISEGYSI